jgi:hypothetical protein
MDIEEIKKKVIQELEGRDPFVDPTSWQLIEKRIPSDLWPSLLDRSGAARFLLKLPFIFPAGKFLTDVEAQLCWERIGNFYKNQWRFHEAISIYLALYYQFLDAQEICRERIRKGTPLVWMSDCYSGMGFPFLSKRCLMLALCENAIHERGNVPPDTTGTYWRLVYRHGLPDAEVKRYGLTAHELWEGNKTEAMFPEWVVQEFDKDWMTELPSPNEAGIYLANRRYVQKLTSELGDKSGETLERLAEYVLSCMPGCRTTRRLRAESTDYDIICSMEGFEVDFRSEFGRYFVCECKDWDKPADFTTIAKFCRVLDSIKARFGILFSKSGISGEGKAKYAEREQVKVFQDRGMVIVVIDQNDLTQVAEGSNFISLLRTKYERVRLDLAHHQAPGCCT